MSIQPNAAAQAEGQSPSASFNIVNYAIRYGALMVVDAMALLLVYLLAGDGIWEFAVFIALVTILVNYINLRPGLEPLRWISPALMLMLLMVVYPIIYTVFVAFTNYGDGHLLTKQQAIELFARDRFLPEEGIEYDWLPYLDEATQQYGLWLTDENGDVFFATQDGTFTEVPADVAQGVPPETYQGYTLLDDRRGQALAIVALEGETLGNPDEPIGITRTTAARYEQRYTYDADRDAIIDNQTGAVFVADNEEGVFINRDAYQAALNVTENPDEVNIDDYDLITGYRVLIGFENFTRFLTSPAISGPLLRVFLWTIAFAFFAVLTTLVLGLFIALLLDTNMPAKRLIRTLLIIPYAVPALIGIATWKGMLDPNLGVLILTWESIFGGGSAPGFFSDPLWAKVGILMINLWLGYPYFMLVCSGALASIPRDMYEAARVDGASNLQQFWGLTVPMLLIAIGPLMIASFTFNFNNFVIIEVFNKGGPAIVGAATPAGHTDILISYAFRLAFGTGRGADFGLASAITIIIFLMVAAVTIFQFRFTRQLEEVSKNV
jgi:arabinogalactan oligomer / maltooligosaccharide transport system permease protein